MDLSGLLLHHGDPVVVTADSAVLPGTFVPLVLPLAALPPDLRARWLLDHPQAAPWQRIEAALVAGRADRAWALLRTSNDAVLLDRRYEIPVQAWIAEERRRLACPGGAAEILVRRDQAWRAGDTNQLLGLRDSRDVLVALPWPRWLGPILVVDPADPLWPGAALRRPALPLVTLEAVPAREGVARAVADLALHLSGEPDQGWPAWIRIGTIGVCAAVARGEGPSPRAMHARRQEAGIAGISACLASPTPDAGLATAICAYLLHSGRRHRFNHLLDPLRHGADAVTALRIGYGLGVEDLVERR